MAAFNVAGVTVNIGNLRQAVSAAIDDSRCGQGFCLFTLNLDHCAKLRGQQQFQEAYHQARHVTADGFPIVLLGRLNGISVERATGADLLIPLCAQAAHHGISVFLLGPNAAVLQRAEMQLTECAPDLLVAGSYAPGPSFDPQSIDADVAIECIRRSCAQLCFIALGAPRQEIFAARCLSEMPDTGFVCVGAALDFLVGTQARAPQFFRNHCLEWLWRLWSNPRQLARRYLQCAAIFPRIALETISQMISARMRQI